MEHEKIIRACTRKYYKSKGKLNTEEDIQNIAREAVASAITKFDESKKASIDTYLWAVARNTILNEKRREKQHPAFAELSDELAPSCDGFQDDLNFVNDMENVLSEKEMSIFWLVQSNATKEEMYELGYTKYEVAKCFKGIRAKYLSLEENRKILTLKKKPSKQDTSLQQLPSRPSKNISLVAHQ